MISPTREGTLEDESVNNNYLGTIGINWESRKDGQPFKMWGKD